MTTKKRALDEELGEVHQLLARFYISKLKDGTLSAAEASSAVKFLKDNKIESTLTRDDHESALKASLPEFTEDDADVVFQGMVQ